MAETENSLFAIDVDDSDNSADEDAIIVDRTHQSEADFASVKSSYIARQDGGNLYAELVESVPCLKDGDFTGEAVKLDKRQQLLLGYVVGELWYDGEIERAREVCERVLQRCAFDSRLRVGVERWRDRAVERLAKGDGK
ncbi:hypothetical protein Q7P37_009018 [Cladosporium fusiforme]